MFHAEREGGDEPANTGEPAGDDKPAPPPRSGPRNPWAPPPVGPGRRSAGIEDIFRSRGRPGGNGGGNGGGPGGEGRPGGPVGGGMLPRLPVSEARAWMPWALAGAVALWFVSSTVHQLGSTQEGVVTTFGRYSDTIGSGLNLTLPWPIQHVVVTDVTSIRRASIPDSDGEKLMLTSDQNLVDLSYLVRWNVKNLRDYSYQLKDPDLTVREVAEAAMRASVAEVPLVRVIGGAGRADIEQAVCARMQAILDAYRSGVMIQGVDIKKADPPEKVVGAFQQVTVSQQEAMRDQSNAQAYAQQAIAQAQADAATFDKVYAQYKLAPEVTRRRMYYETMEKVLSGNDKVIVGNNTTSYLPLPEIRRRAAEAPATDGTAPEGQQ